MHLSNRILMGMVAGAVGTTMLNVVTYLDMAMRGRPPSEVPEKVVDELTNKLDLSLEGTGDREVASNRRSTLGALMGFASGMAWGSIYGAVHPSVGKVPPAVRSAGLGMAVMAGNDAPAIAMRATDPTEWGVAGWISDITPHIVYGVATVASYERLETARR
jgi:hypothetical protein